MVARDGMLAGSSWLSKNDDPTAGDHLSSIGFLRKGSFFYL
jgi:hypothetical protein